MATERFKVNLNKNIIKLRLFKKEQFLHKHATCAQCRLSENADKIFSFHTSKCTKLLFENRCSVYTCACIHFRMMNYSINFACEILVGILIRYSVFSMQREGASFRLINK